jgi:hypothetical protein
MRAVSESPHAWILQSFISCEVCITEYCVWFCEVCCLPVFIQCSVVLKPVKNVVYVHCVVCLLFVTVMFRVSVD